LAALVRVITLEMCSLRGADDKSRITTKASGIEIGLFREKSGTLKSLYFYIIIPFNNKEKKDVLK
jgi:hypothetical protein